MGSKKSLFNISRSFDINKVGINYNNVVGGVIGGSLSAGKFKINDIIEIRPGYVSKNISKPIITKILSIKTDTTFLDEIIPGGLIAIGTDSGSAVNNVEFVVKHFELRTSLGNKKMLFANESVMSNYLLQKLDALYSTFYHTTIIP